MDVSSKIDDEREGHLKKIILLNKKTPRNHCTRRDCYKAVTGGRLIEHSLFRCFQSTVSKYNLKRLLRAK